MHKKWRTLLVFYHQNKKQGGMKKRTVPEESFISSDEITSAKSAR